MRTLVIGDIHGNYRGMVQCLERSRFDYARDRLIALGDICDGYPDIKECFDELLKVQNLIFIRGNHDQWLLEWAGGEHPGVIWSSQGGLATQVSYGMDVDKIPKEHVSLLEEAVFAYVDLATNQLFVHGGIDPNKAIEKQNVDLLMWDRDLIRVARNKHNQKSDYQYAGYSDIFVGHTTTEMYTGEKRVPLRFCNVQMLDTGGGYGGRITIMDALTKQYWQSDLGGKLYPGYIHR